MITKQRETPNDAEPRSLPPAVLLLPVLVTAILAALHFGYTPDDTYIYGQYAKNLLRDGQIAFNRGEPSYGITGPLWLLMTACGGLIGPIVTTGKIIDLFFALSSVGLFFLLARRILANDLAALVSSFVLATHIWFLRWAATGMETSAAVCAVVGVLLAWSHGRIRLSLLLAGFLALLRPEGALLGLLLLGDVFRKLRRDGGNTGRLIAPAVLYAAPLFVWNAYAYAAFGSTVPNTALAKAGRQFTFSEMTDTTADLLKTVAASDGIILMIGVMCGVLLLLRRRTQDTKHRQAEPVSSLPVRYSVLSISFGLLVTGYYVLSGTNVVSRYTLLFTPPLIIVAFAALERSIDTFRWRSFRQHIILMSAGAVMMVHSAFYWTGVVPHMDSFASGMDTALKPMGVWLSRNAPGTSKVVMTDVGAVGYFSDRYICDMGGLISTDALALTAGGIDSYDAIRDGAYASFCEADYVIHRARESAALRGQEGLDVIMARPFSGLAMTDTSKYVYTLYRIIR